MTYSITKTYELVPAKYGNSCIGCDFLSGGCEFPEQVKPCKDKGNEDMIWSEVKTESKI